LYSTPNVIRVIKSRRIRWAGHVACVGEKRTTYRILVGKPEGKRPLGRTKGRWVNNCKHGNEPSGSINCWEVLE
jgi:hypothetical protein